VGSKDPESYNGGGSRSEIQVELRHLLCTRHKNSMPTLGEKLWIGEATEPPRGRSPLPTEGAAPGRTGYIRSHIPAAGRPIRNSKTPAEGTGPSCFTPDRILVRKCRFVEENWLETPGSESWALFSPWGTTRRSARRVEVSTCYWGCRNPPSGVSPRTLVCWQAIPWP